MAELLGLVSGGAGVASLAVQIGQAVVRLKELYDCMKEAPKEVTVLVDELLLLARLLERLRSDDDESDLWQECYEYCKRTRDTLSQLADQIATKLQTAKTRGRLKWVLNSNSIAKQREKLDSAKTMLLLAQQQAYFLRFTQSQQSQQNQVAELEHTLKQELQECRNQVLALADSISACTENHSTEVSALTNIMLQQTKPISTIEHKVSRLSLQLLSASRTPLDQSDDGTLVLSGDQSILADPEMSNRPHIPKRVMFSYRISSWWLRKIWYFEVSKACNSWTTTFRTENVVSQVSMGMICACSGTVAEMRQLFKNKLVSIYDRTDDGSSLLHRASAGENLEMCQFLISVGVDPNALDHGLRPALYTWVFHIELAFIRNKPIRSKAHQLCLYLFKTNLEGETFEHDSVSTGEILYSCYPRPHFDEFEQLVNALSVRCSERALSRRLQAALCIRYSDPAYFWARLGHKPATEVDADIVARESPIELLELTWEVAKHCCFYYHHTTKSHSSGWQEILFQLLKARHLRLLCDKVLEYFPVDDCWLNRNGWSHWSVILFQVHSHTLVLSERATNNLNRWVAYLSDAGISLREYGELITALISRSSNGEVALGPEHPRILCTNPFYNEIRYRIVGFSYGPVPKDWKVFLSTEHDEYCHEFWPWVETESELVDEDEPLVLPGSWPDSCSLFPESSTTRETPGKVGLEYRYWALFITSRRRRRRLLRWLRLEADTAFIFAWESFLRLRFRKSCICRHDRQPVYLCPRHAEPPTKYKHANGATHSVRLSRREPLTFGAEVRGWYDKY